jgi:cytochrome c553
LKKLVIFVLGVYTLLVAASLVFAQVSAGKLTAERCTACHDSARICEKLAVRDAETWAATVARMRATGAKLNDDEVQTVAEYLSTAKPGAKPLCVPAATAPAGRKAPAK